MTTTAKCNQCHDPLVAPRRQLPRGQGLRDLPQREQLPDPGQRRTATGTTARTGSTRFTAENSPTESRVTYPQDSRTCATCHDSSLSGGNVWYTYPTRAACGGCHADINWVTGAGHSAQNLPQTDDTACASCHPPQGTDEYDTSIKNAHIVPSDSKQLKGLNVDDPLDVRTSPPGRSRPSRSSSRRTTGRTSRRTRPGSRSASTLDGNTKDYPMQPVSRERDGAAYNADATGVATYTFTNAIPANATGTWTFSAQSAADRQPREGRRRDDQLHGRGGEPDLQRLGRRKPGDGAPDVGLARRSATPATTASRTSSRTAASGSRSSSASSATTRTGTTRLAARPRLSNPARRDLLRPDDPPDPHGRRS